MTVGAEGEFATIARITSALPSAAGVLLGPGDDAAVVAAPDGRVVTCIDLVVEGRHFRPDWSSPVDVGRKAAARSLADVAAMGARPTSLVVALACPPTTPLDWVDGVRSGLAAEAAVAGTAVVGGDLASADSVLVAVSATGDLGGRAAVLRTGARVGDLVVTVGRLGYAAAGLALLDAGRVDPDPPADRRRGPGAGPLDDLVEAHRHPEVPYAAGPLLALAGASSMIDVSDGLLADLGHVASGSGVAVVLDARRLPVPPPLLDAARLLDADPLAWVATGGDDHALVATVPAAASDLLARALAAAGCPPPVVVGEVVAGPAGVAVTGHDLGGARGHEHFR